MSWIDDLRNSAEADIRVYFDQETPGDRLDIASIVSAAAHDAHLYCCGPGPMLEAFHLATAHRGGDFVHTERFGSAEKAKRDTSFQIELARSGLTLDVDQGQSILDVLLKAGVGVAFSCEEGVCGTCEVAVLAGAPDHRDEYLTGAEREQNKTMMICCSRSLSAKLVLDL
jgi:vanillate O-demethylase ferredoxin subunit